MVTMSNANRQLRFEYIEPLDLKATWPLIKEGVKNVTERQDVFIIEDVYADIKQGLADLHLAYFDDEYEGFVVMQKQPWHDGMGLHVWLAYSIAGKEDCILQQGAKIMFEWLKNMNGKRITFSSKREGWKRMKMCRPIQTIYEIQGDLL